jgi:hypothetical protein
MLRKQNRLLGTQPERGRSPKPGIVTMITESRRGGELCRTVSRIWQFSETAIQAEPGGRHDDAPLPQKG